MSRGPTITLNDNFISNCGTGVRIRGNATVDASGNRIADCAVAWDIDGTHPPAELILETIRILKANGITSSPTDNDAEIAAEKSGLKQWLIQNGVGLASLAATFAQLMQG